MKYDNKNILPTGITNNLPQAAQDIYKKVYNKSYECNINNENVESIAHRRAWSEVKKKFQMSYTGNWNKK